MTVALRPMSLGEILDRTFQIYRSRFLVFVGIAAVPAVWMSALYLLNLLWWKLKVPSSPLRFLGIGISQLVYLLLVYHASLFFHALMWPASNHAARQVYFGEAATVWLSFRKTARRWKSVCGLTGALWLAVLVLPELVAAIVWVAILAFLSEGLKMDDYMDSLIMPITVMMTTGGWVLSLWVGAWLLFAFPAHAFEELSVRKSLKRARTLTKGVRWRLVVGRLVPGLLSWVVYLGLSQSSFWILRFFIWRNHLWLRQGTLILGTVNIGISFLVAVLLGPVFPIILTLFYYDQRIRKEGYDIERMMDAGGMTAVAVPVTSMAEDLIPQVTNSSEAEVQPG